MNVAKKQEDYPDPVPIIGEEVFWTQDSMTTGPSDNRRQIPVLPTGIAPYRIQYVGEVLEKKIHNDADPRQVRIKSSDGGRWIYMFAHDTENSDYEKATELSEGSYIGITGQVQLHKKRKVGTFSYIAVESIIEVSREMRYNYLISAADIVLRRIEKLQQYRNSNLHELSENISNEVDPRAFAINEYPCNIRKLTRMTITTLDKAIEEIETKENIQNND